MQHGSGSLRCIGVQICYLMERLAFNNHGIKEFFSAKGAVVSFAAVTAVYLKNTDGWALELPRALGCRQEVEVVVSWKQAAAFAFLGHILGFLLKQIVGSVTNRAGHIELIIDSIDIDRKYRSTNGEIDTFFAVSLMDIRQISTSPR